MCNFVEPSFSASLSDDISIFIFEVFGTTSLLLDRLLVRASYYNAVGSLSLTPTIVFYHDIDGTSPVPVANFIEHRKTITASLGLGSLGVWDVKLGYTNSYGGGRYNLRTDRDFMSLTASYSY